MCVYFKFVTRKMFRKIICIHYKERLLKKKIYIYRSMRILTAKILLKSVRIILECYIEETCKSHFFIQTDKYLE